MKIKGLHEFQEKVSFFTGKKILLVPIYFISIFTISFLIQFSFDLLPIIFFENGIKNEIIILFPILGIVLMGCCGLFLVYQMWSRKDRLKAKYGQLAYQKIILIGLTGLSVIISISIHNWIPFYRLNSIYLSYYPLSLFSTPLPLYFTSMYSLFSIFQLILGIFFLVIGILMTLRAVSTFGIDYMALVYLYFPEESKLQDHEIYSVLRHPAYASLVLICMGGMLFQMTLYSIINFIFYYFLFNIHIHFVEEKELINRFGNSYKDYQKRVPAIFIRPKNWKIFFKYLLGKTH